MKHQFLFSLKDINMKKYIIILLIIEMIFTILFFSFTSTQAFIGINQESEINKLKDINIFNFNLIDKEGTYTEAIHSKIMDKLNKNEAYTIIDMYSLESYPDYKLIITLGAFDKVFRLDKFYDKRENETIAYIGNGVKGISVNDILPFGDIGDGSAKVVSHIPKNMNYILDERVESFENTILISTNLDYFKTLYYPIAMISSTSFINQSNEFLQEYNKNLYEAGGNYLPSSLNQYSKTIKDYLIIDGLSAAVLFFVVLIFVFITTIIIILQVIDSNMKEYSIHLLYGARFKEIFIRNFITISAIILPVILIFNKFFSEGTLEKKLTIIEVFIVYFIITLILNFISLWKIRKLELEDYFERNE
ncbi:hypothetical protein [Clostridium tertium]|uniref:FtsX-like permease family protein n=1 Tax=Clostridium tertium TaxID=1559 RepID=A0A6N3GZ38_9CLOT